MCLWPSGKFFLANCAKGLSQHVEGNVQQNKTLKANSNREFSRKFGKICVVPSDQLSDSPTSSSQWYWHGNLNLLRRRHLNSNGDKMNAAQRKIKILLKVQAFIECFRGRHRAQFYFIFRFSGTFFGAAKRAFATLKFAPP